jgi:hypothetical protein
MIMTSTQESTRRTLPVTRRAQAIPATAAEGNR